jgi:flagellar assembly factor FliW
MRGKEIMNEQILAREVEKNADEDAVVFSTLRFGEVSVAASSVIEFPHGLVGMDTARRFVFLHEKERDGVFHWMQSVDDPALAFITCEPQLFFPDYQVPLSKEDQEILEITNVEEGLVCVILVVPSNPREITANLRGPVVVNAERRVGHQLVLAGDEYPVRQALFVAGGEGDGSCSS